MQTKHQHERSVHNTQGEEASESLVAHFLVLNNQARDRQMKGPLTLQLIRTDKSIKRGLTHRHRHKLRNLDAHTSTRHNVKGGIASSARVSNDCGNACSPGIYCTWLHRRESVLLRPGLPCSRAPAASRTQEYPCCPRGRREACKHSR